jgi:DnaK suppressor protein
VPDGLTGAVFAISRQSTEPEGSVMNTAQLNIDARAPQELAIRLADLRAALEQQRRFRLDQLHELAENAANSPPAPDDPYDHVSEILATGALTALAEIESALERVRAGRYGSCERCTAHIPYERLEILPMSRYCMGCQRDRNRPLSATSTRRTLPEGSSYDSAVSAQT